jgi:hypothetical protein
LALNESALSEASTEEGGVDSDQNPRTLLECDSREEKTAPEQDFEDSDEAHGSIIVFLDELANHISVWVCLGGWLGAGAGTCCGSNWLARLDGGNEVCAGIGRDVEDRVDTEWEHSERVLGREEPDEGHSQVLDILISDQRKRARRGLCARSRTSTESLINHDSIRHRCGNKGGAVRESCPSRVVVECDVGEPITSDTKEE